jgi:mannose-6-phosphate isomerase-like protein (cupin superfamily)
MEIGVQGLAMTLSKQVSIRCLESIHGGMAEFYTPQSSNETMLVKVPAKAHDDLFVHRYQTDQLLVVRGSFVLVVLENRRYRYIAMSEDYPQVVTVPPGVPHGAVNPNNSDCWLVNAVLRHGASYPKDYQPIKKPFEYDLVAAEKALVELNRSHSQIVLSTAN